MSLDARLIAYTPNGASLGPLPTPDSWDAAFPLNDVPALTMGYSPDGARASLLGQPIEVAVEVSHDGGATWAEPPDGRYLYLRDGRDPAKSGDLWSVDAPGYIWRLTKAKLIRGTGVWTDEGRNFTATVGSILHTLFTEAQARGALVGITWNFTAANDSNGVAWGATHTLDRTYSAGTDFLAILQDMANQGLIDYRMVGRQVQVYKAKTFLATDKTLVNPPVLIRAGQDVLEAPFRRTWEGIAGYAFVQGDNGAYVERTNAGAVQPWGRWETYLAQGGVDDAGTLTILGDLNLATMADARLEHTTGLDFDRATFLPFRDYYPGHYVYRQVDGTVAPERVQVRQITLSKGTDGRVQGNVVLNDRFTDSDLRIAQQIEALTGAPGGGTGSVPGTGPDILAPNQVAGLTSSSVGYFDASGLPQSQITLDWNDLATNADGSAMTDLDHYEVWQKPNGSPDYAKVTDVAVSVWTGSPYQVGSVWDFRVRAIDTVGNEGAWSVSTTRTGANPTAVPATPAAVSLSVRLGVLMITHNGLNSVAGAYGPDLDHFNVHLSTVSGFTPSAANLIDALPPGGGVSVVGGLPYSTPHYVKVVAVSKARPAVASLASAEATTSITPLVNTDLVGTPVASANISSLVADKITTGLLSATLTISGTIQTAASGARVKLDATGLKAYNASNVVMVDISATTGLGTFTGGLATAASGPRTVIGLGVTAQKIEQYSADPAEVSPFSILTSIVSFYPTTTIEAGRLNAGSPPAKVILTGVNAGGNLGSVSLDGAFIYLTNTQTAGVTGAQVQVNGDMYVKGVAGTAQIGVMKADWFASFSGTMRPVEANVTTTGTRTGSTVYVLATLGNPTLTFVCPPSGTVLIIISCRPKITAGTSYGVVNYQIRANNAAGAIIVAPNDRGGALTFDLVEATVMRQRIVNSVDGLVPGNTYYVETMSRVGVAATALSWNDCTITVIPTL